MEVILLERIHNLGNFGDVVKVKDGYARNFLIPRKKSLRATAKNKLEFETRRAEIEKKNTDNKKESEKNSAKVDGQFIVLVRQAGEDGRLYGSVSAKDISDATSALSSLDIKRSQVVQFSPIKALGIHVIKIALHPEVIVNVNVNVARTASEAELAKKEFLAPKKTEISEEAEALDASESDNESEVSKSTKKKKKGVKVIDIELQEDTSSEVA